MSEVLEKTGAKPEKKPEPPKMHEKHLKQEEYAFARMSAVLPVGVTIDQVLQPEFWSNVAHRFKGDQLSGQRDHNGAIIAVRWADHSGYAALYVREVLERGLNVALVSQPVYFGPQGAIGNAAFKTRWNVGKQQHEVLRASDNEVVASVGTKEKAQEWIDKTMGRAA